MQNSNQPYYLRITGYLFDEDLDQLLENYKLEVTSFIDQDYFGWFGDPVYVSQGERIIPFQPLGKTQLARVDDLVAAKKIFLEKGYFVKCVAVDETTGELKEAQPLLNI